MKRIILVTAVIMVLILSACSGAQEGDPSITADQQSLTTPADPILDGSIEQPDESQVDNQNQEMEQLSSQMRLILGSLTLDQTGLNLSPEQASALLPLWKVMKTLFESDTSAAAEIEALFNQIRSELTPDQQAWVDNFSISQEEYRAILTEYVPEDLLNSGTLMTEEEREERRATAIAENGGTVPQELQGSGGGRGMGGGSGVPRSITGETPGDGTGEGQGTGAGGGQINIYLIDALILKLELVTTP